MPLRESTKLPVRVVLLKLYKLIISPPETVYTFEKERLRSPRKQKLYLPPTGI